jgi:2-(1,2-epoxy-1,2-dihydrophenyl)acetyl-CoA isomerase
MPDFETIRYETSDGVAVVTLARPERRNAINAQLARDVVDALAEAGADDAVRVVLITGEGASFCSGQDLTAFDRAPTPDEVYEAVQTVYVPLIRALTESETTVVAAVNGAAAGAGMSLALACDLRVMADDALLIPGFSSIGLVPDAGASWFLARQLGYARALEVLALDRRLPAEECLRLGLANRVAPAASLIEEALEYARALAARPPVALALTRRALRAAITSDLADALEREAQLQRQASTTDDHREGVAAFLQKRAPRFTGR